MCIKNETKLTKWKIIKTAGNTFMGGYPLIYRTLKEYSSIKNLCTKTVVSTELCFQSVRNSRDTIACPKW